MEGRGVGHSRDKPGVSLDRLWTKSTARAVSKATGEALALRAAQARAGTTSACSMVGTLVPRSLASASGQFRRIDWSDSKPVPGVPR